MKTEETDRLQHERRLWSGGLRFVAGVDEAGRGPLAGPVVAAAVVFRPGENIAGVRDSKKLSPEQREALYPLILQRAAASAVEAVSEDEIDRINILQATYAAMRKAVSGLGIEPGHVLVDGYPIPGLPFPQTALVGGDDLSMTIGAASILAKVTRDRMMVEFDRLFPQYGFARHKGYGTREHVRALRQFGPCPIHRKSFTIKSDLR
jgi:ribonuclease HII